MTTDIDNRNKKAISYLSSWSIRLIFIFLVSGCVPARQYYSVELELSLDGKHHSLKEHWGCEKNWSTGSWQTLYEDRNKIRPAWFLQNRAAVVARVSVCDWLVENKDYRIVKLGWVENYENITCLELKEITSPRINLVSARIIKSHHHKANREEEAERYRLLGPLQRAIFECK
jgi:hypothetical protein